MARQPTRLRWFYRLRAAGYRDTPEERRLVPAFRPGFAYATGIAVLLVAGLLVNVAAIAKRILIVVPSLTHGSLLPYGPGEYTPTWVEYSIVVGLFALGTLLYAVFLNVFPILEVVPEGGEGR